MYCVVQRVLTVLYGGTAKAVSAAYRCGESPRLFLDHPCSQQSRLSNQKKKKKNTKSLLKPNNV